LIEHYNGNLPVSLAPTQVKVLPISGNYVEYARKICRKLLVRGVRAEVDDSDSTISYKIREAETQKVPYMVICGKREVILEKISVRRHGQGDIDLLTIAELIKKTKYECNQ
jgi:threonyl-tRNA synthetase